MPSSLASYMFGTNFLGVGLYLWAVPGKAHQMFGMPAPVLAFPLDSAQTDPAKTDPAKTNPAAAAIAYSSHPSAGVSPAFLFTTVGRIAVDGAFLILLEVLGNHQAVGLFMASVGATAVMDGVLVAKYGAGAATVCRHIGGGLTLALAAWWRLKSIGGLKVLS